MGSVGRVGTAAGDVYRVPLLPETNPTGFSLAANRGMQMALKAGTVGTWSAGWTQEMDFPDASDPTDYREAIATCPAWIPTVGLWAGQECDDPTDHDPEPAASRPRRACHRDRRVSAWATLLRSTPARIGTQAPSGGHEHSTRVHANVPIVLFHTADYAASGCGGTGCIVKVVNIMGFFVEGMCDDRDGAGPARPDDVLRRAGQDRRRSDGESRRSIEAGAARSSDGNGVPADLPSGPIGAVKARAGTIAAGSGNGPAVVVYGWAGLGPIIHSEAVPRDVGSMVTQPSTPHQLTSLLLDARNVDGGWGYYAGKSSRLEPTCWALLALRNTNASIDSAVLKRWPARDGLLLERAGGEPNYAFHALGLLVLSRFLLEHETGNIRLASTLQRVKGVSLKPSAAFRQNNALQAWPWVAETFSWVEPTAWCLLALKQFGRSFPASVDSSRIAEAEHLLLDRVCTGGGWNYGNPSVLGQELRAHVPPRLWRSLRCRTAGRNQRCSRASTSSRAMPSPRCLQALFRSRRSHFVFTVDRRTISRRPCAKQVPTSVSLGNLLGLSQALFTMTTTYDNSAFSI